jgi:putative hydrolase of the HAD superfamily
MKKYKYIFFDLDHTLWDFERNAEETKQEIYIRYGLKDRGIESYQAFREKYVPINTGLWDLYRENKIEKDDLNFKRFYLTLCQFGIEDKVLGASMANDFIDGISEKTFLFPYAVEILEYLNPKYLLYIITNGFEEVQYRKLAKSGMDKYFTKIITSEAAGSKKPDSEIFRYAFELTGASLSESIMIGDDPLVDIGGARNFGIDQLFVNFDGSLPSCGATYEVSSLREIEDIL